MNLSFLKDIQREHFNEIATELMNHYCILKHDREITVMLFIVLPK